MKRSNGSGGISRRGKVWRISLSVEQSDGSRIQVTKTVHGTKREADDELARLRSEHPGRLAGAADATVADLLGMWLDNAEHAATTRADYVSVIHDYLPGPIGGMKAWRLRPLEIQRVYRQLAEQGVSAHRIHRLHNALRAAYKFGVLMELVPRNPVKDASPPTIRRRDISAPDASEVDRLVNAAGDDLLAWLMVAAVSGARRGEVCGLQWADIDLPAKVLRFRRAVAYTPAAGVHVKPTKTERPKIVSIDAATTVLLRDHRRSCVENALAAGIALRDDAFVFSLDVDGVRPWRPDLATKRFGRLRSELGLSGVQLRELRHSVATRLLAAGVDPKTVAQRLGHARVSTTLDIYAAWVPARDREAADLLAITRPGLEQTH